MTHARGFAPSPVRRTELHRQIEARCALSRDAAMLLVELDMRGEVVLGGDEHLASLVELEARGLAERAGDHACVHAVPTSYVREVMERVRSIIALEGELARRGRSRRLASEPTAPDSKARRNHEAPLSPEHERAIVEDALAVIDRTPVFPAAGDVRVYLRTGPRYVRVFWTYRRMPDDDGGSILHFIERASGKVYNAKSARQVGRFTGRVLAGIGGGADA